MADNAVRDWLTDELYPWMEAVTDKLNDDQNRGDGEGDGPIVLPPPPPPPPTGG